MNNLFSTTGAMAFCKYNEKEIRCMQYIEGRAEHVLQLVENIQSNKRMKEFALCFEERFRKKLYRGFEIKSCTSEEFNQIKLEMNKRLVEELFRECDLICSDSEDMTYD
eukprot:UN14225